MSELLSVLLRANLGLALAVAAVLALRLPARRLFGARIAYSLWLLVPLAALATLTPPRVVHLTAPTVALIAAPSVNGTAIEAGGPALVHSAIDLAAVLTGLWLTGVLVALLQLSWRQVRFARAVREGRAGPAVVGVWRPRIVTPDDFAVRYTPDEQRLILAHESAHLTGQDSRINALAALVHCLGWFNPFVHLLGRYLRLDQELACDAAVIAAHPRARRPYAEALLKTQLSAVPLPLGCYWPARSLHPLSQRIRLLSNRLPGPARRRLGAVGVLAIGLVVAASVWAARPPQLVWTAPVETIARTAVSATPAKSVASAPAKRAPQPLRSEVAAPPETAVGDGASLMEVGDPAPAPLMSEPVSTPLVADASALAPRIYAVARRSSVEPGSAVRVVASMADRDGVTISTDFTAFGSQSLYRTGSYSANGSRRRLFTSVEQHGDKLRITASMNRAFAAPALGAIELASGETGRIVLGDGQTVTVTPTIRAETAEEVDAGRRALMERPFFRWLPRT